MGLTLDPKEMVRNLDASYKQIVEISRALLMNAKMIIMDEPTTSLTDPEIEKVFAILRQLREQKVGIVFISHKLREVMEICDSYTVLRDGVMVASGSVKDVTTSDLARFMVGHDVRTEKLGTGAQRGGERLSLQRRDAGAVFPECGSERRMRAKVLGVTGLLGRRRSELFSAVFGAETVSGGNQALRKPRAHHVHLAGCRLGLAYVPRKPQENGIIKGYVDRENGTIVSWRELMRHLAGHRAAAKRRSLSGESGAAHQDGKRERLDHQPVRRQPAEGRAGQMASAASRRCSFG